MLGFTKRRFCGVVLASFLSVSCAEQAQNNIVCEIVPKNKFDQYQFFLTADDTVFVSYLGLGINKLAPVIRTAKQLIIEVSPYTSAASAYDRFTIGVIPGVTNKFSFVMQTVSVPSGKIELMKNGICWFRD